MLKTRYRFGIKGVIKYHGPVLIRAVGSIHFVATGFNPLTKRDTPVPECRRHDAYLKIYNCSMGRSIIPSSIRQHGPISPRRKAKAQDLQFTPCLLSLNSPVGYWYEYQSSFLSLPYQSHIKVMDGSW